MQVILDRGEIEAIKAEVGQSLINNKYVPEITKQISQEIGLNYDHLREDVKILVREEVKAQLNKIVKQEISKLVSAAVYEELVQKAKGVVDEGVFSNGKEE